MQSVTLCLRVSENAAHKHVFKLLAPVQWDETASRGTAARSSAAAYFSKCSDGHAAVIYGVCVC